MSLAFRNLLFSVVVPGYEERALRRRFGETYTEYVRTVPRWIPRPTRRG
jgi:protein-S-isoprenylcysteine O-methyltransferase Ste14